jgi:hypothetical protein
VDRLDSRLSSHRAQVTTDASSRALVIIASALDRAVEERFGRLRTDRAVDPSSLHWDAYTRGRQSRRDRRNQVSRPGCNSGLRVGMELYLSDSADV